MTIKTSPQKYLTITAISVLLTMLTVVMGAPLMRLLRKAYGSKAYWMGGLIVTGVLWFVKAEPLAMFVGSVWMTLGVYDELEQKGLGWWVSGLTSILAGASTGALTAYGIFVKNGIQTFVEVQKAVDEFARRIESVNPKVKVDTETLLQQIPSAVIIILILALGLGLIFERRVFIWLKMPRVKIASQLKLLEYRVPDYMIWIAMTAFLLTMVSFGVKAIVIVSLNIVNVMVVLYFFQGLAVMEVFLNSMRAGFLTRVLAYTILVGQLFLLLSIVGLIDYWLDFRRRMINLNARTSE